MVANSLLNLAFLSFYSASLLLLLPFQPFAASRGPFLPKYDAGNAGLPLSGICSAAVTINGYKCQEFDVTTDDGYILSVLRIPEGRAGGGGANRPPVLLQHGLLVDGMSWLMNPPEESLALILADNGFDVWISSVRGTQFSRRHLTLDPSNSILETYGPPEFNPRGEAEATFIESLCAYPGVDCYKFLPAFTGNNCCLNASTAETFVKHNPQPTSTKNLVHFSQAVRSGVVSKYDYGNGYANTEHYGVPSPPVHDLSKIPHDFPLYLGYGGQDALSDVPDVLRLLDVLKPHDQDKIKVQYVEQYGHVDFIMGVDAKDLVYGEILDFFRAHN
ncbi:UNVERIFIED_CONTAM: Triacylglycerol lipase 2 [Sesamum radiatum]|uniref:Triacylglycerol lipase 2 n=1 Tax=Sesamum radiatum TaxID=300843 RepID=A0AAW2RC10_SESRA